MPQMMSSHGGVLLTLCVMCWTAATRTGGEQAGQQQRKGGVEPGEQLAVIKRTLESMLDYHGLEDPPDHREADMANHEYLQTVFALMNGYTEAQVANDQTGAQTIWGIQPTTVDYTVAHVELRAVIQPEVFRVRLSRAELVFEVLQRGLQNVLAHYTHTSNLTLCTDVTSVRSCVSHRRPQYHQIMIRGKLFRVYEITSSVSSLLQVVGQQNVSFPVVVQVPQPATGLTLQPCNVHLPMLVLYANLPTTMLWQHVQPASSRGTRVRRTAPLFTPPVYLPSSTGQSGPLGSLPAWVGGSQVPIGCTRVSWHVDFRDISWNNVILSPTSYDAGVCVGSCALDVIEQVNTSQHAIIKARFEIEARNRLNSSMREQQLVPTAKCVPISLRPISVTFSSGNRTIVQRKMPGMSVVECGCH